MLRKKVLPSRYRKAVSVCAPHLCRSLVGEGYGKYLPVGAWIDYQMLDVFHSQRKGLA